MYSERVKKKLRIKLRKMHADLGQLDILVESEKCRQANLINNKGLRAQVDYLLKFYTPREVRSMAWDELTRLQKYGMKRQSKCIPENNIKIDKKKKKKK